jgi:hypothetical protein
MVGNLSKGICGSCTGILSGSWNAGWFVDGDCDVCCQWDVWLISVSDGGFCG